MGVKIKEVFRKSYNDKPVKSELFFPEFIMRFLNHSKKPDFHIMCISKFAITVIVAEAVYNYYPVITFGGK